MDEIQVKTKQWVEAITKERMNGVVDELQEILGGQKAEIKNKVIFKLLLYLSHTASKCDKSKKAVGLEIRKLARWICSNLTIVPDPKNFFLSIYHITSCLLDMALYKEAVEMCDYVLSGQLTEWKCSDSDGVYRKLSQLLQNASVSLLETSKLSTRKHYETTVSMIECELEVIKLAHRSCWRYILSRILSYCKKIRAIVDKSAQKFKEEFVECMLTYMSQQEIVVEDKNREHTYRLICQLITEMILSDVDKIKIGSSDNTSTRYFDVFRSCMKNSQSYADCLKLYERVSITIVRPYENLSYDTRDELSICLVELRKLKTSCEYADAVKWYSYSLILILSEVLGYWEECAKNDATACKTDAWMSSMMMFLDEQCDAFNSYELTDCRCSKTTKCSMNHDAYNDVTLRLKVLSVMSRIVHSRRSKFNEKMCDITVEFAIKCKTGISAMKENRCKLWSSLWPACVAYMYNIALSCETRYPKNSIKLYTLLLQSFVNFEGLDQARNGTNDASKVLKIRDPLFTFLNRLTSVQYNHGHYDNARLSCCLNGLLSSRRSTIGTTQIEQHKAYVSWTNIQTKHPPARDQTMLEYYRLNIDKICQLVEITSSDFDPIEVCFREIKALADGRIDFSSSMIRALNEMGKLHPSPVIYSQAVQFIGYHSLNLKSEFSIGRYLRKATIAYERDVRPTTSFKLSQGHVKFYEFVQQLNDNTMETMREMKSAKLALTSTMITNHGDTGSTSQEPKKIVPVYSTINMSVTMKLALSLERALTIWQEITNENDYREKLNDWEIVQTLEVATIAGEYARLYHWENLEIQLWNLVRKLARITNDHRSIIYTTMRCLGNFLVHRDWIDEAEKSIEIVEKSEDSEIQRIIEIYKVCLAELYNHNDDYEKGKLTFVPTTNKLDESFESNAVNFLFSAHLRMNDSGIVNDDDDQSNYTRIIVQCLYTILSIDDGHDLPIGRDFRRKQLHYYDVIFEHTYNLAMRMNSLLSFREISAHLIRRLDTAQKLGAAMRVAECLKSLCYIDLSRAKLDDCEVKLQGLEHILEIEAFDTTMRSEKIFDESTCDLTNLQRATTTITSNYVVEEVRDAGQNDASPVLRSKKFANPVFVIHRESCMCFKCTNKCYQSLVFAATHLRAQLFALRRNVTSALQHFVGALTIKKNILARSKMADGRDDDTRGGKIFNDDSSRFLRNYRHLDVVEFVMFHLDYCRFVKWSMPERMDYGVEIALEARRLCVNYKLENHPIYAAANQLLFEYRFERLYDNNGTSNFTIPPVDEIDIGRYIHDSQTEPIVCATPIREAVAQKSHSLRRRKTPPFLNLEKVPIDLTDEKSPTLTPTTTTSSPPPRTRRTGRRRITEIPSQAVDVVPTRQKKTNVPRLTFTIPEDDDDDDERDKIVATAKPVTGRKKRSNTVQTIETESTTTNCQTQKNATTTRGRSQRITRQRSTSSGEKDAEVGKNLIEAKTTPQIVNIDEVMELIEDMKITRASSTIVNERSSRNSRRPTNSATTSDGGTTSSDEAIVPVEVRRTRSSLKKKSVKS